MTSIAPARSRRRRALLLLAGALAAAGCARADRAAPAPPLLELLPPAATGVAFANELPEDGGFDILDYLYYYNGGGVAVGDVNGDGLPDLYFSATVGPNRLYLNRGGFRFEDVTERAGVAGPPGLKTGVTMADVNGDGRVDIYVSAVSHGPMRGRNVLYVNDGDGTFTDRTRELGLDYAGYATQAVFFDYDGDGDLDAYLLTHSTHARRRPGAAAPADPAAGDRLLRNDGGRFVDVTARAGIRDVVRGSEGFGLGVVVSDVDLDGCPDVYVANDFQEDDQLYLNRCDGTFAESLARAAGHTSRFSMGVDAADYDNDGRPDLFVADMLPEREEIRKTSASTESAELFELQRQAGYRPQYARNTLQLNRGLGRFSEVGYLAGVHATDWSWAPLFVDLDDDGRKDLFITSGIYRRPNDLDYIDYVGNEAVQASLAGGGARARLAVLQRMPRVPLPDHAFRNRGDLTFEDASAAWGLTQTGFSNGAAYVDLDNDGALDLVVNRIGAPAAIYRNHARTRTGNGYLTVVLRGAGANTAGIGAKVYVRAGGITQLVEQMPTRGFESSVDPRLHVGLGRARRMDSLTVVWPDRRYQVLTGVRADTTLTLAQDDAAGRYDYRRARPPAAAAGPGAGPLLADATPRLGLDFRHVENAFTDYSREPLLPHLLSAEGPALATADVDGDGLDDVYVGGAKWQPGRLYLQQRDGTFRARDEPALAADSLAEDVDAAFLDADGDGDQDLYVASGGNEFWGTADALRGRLYLNDGRGRFRRAVGALPDVFENASCVVPGDFDGDGHVDLFVGSRVVARRYGETPQSHLLRNDGTGRFTDVTAARAPGLATAGMVTAAAWTDYDGDGRRDLVVVGEWMPVRVFHQEGGRLVERTAEAGLAGSEGWWSSVTAADLDGDGRDDLVLGNLGLNSYLTASPREPLRLYVHDFARDGGLQQVLTRYAHGVSSPLAGRDELARAIPSLRARYPTYTSFGAGRVEDVFPRPELRQATVLEARVLATSVALNRGGGTFALHPLPVEAQLAPVRASLAADLDGDGRTDLLLAGNDHGVPPVLGRYDASYGTLLRGLGGGRFAAVDLAAAGVAIDGQVRHMRWVRHAGGGRLIVVARNDTTLQVLRPLRAAAGGSGAAAVAIGRGAR